MERDFDWWGIIGPVPRLNPSGWIAVPHDVNATLDQPYEVGPIRIRPGERRLVEFLRTEPRTLSGITRVESRPIIVEGNWPGSLIERDERYKDARVLGGERANEYVANSWLYRAAALVAIAFEGEPWQVRSAATDSSRLPAQVPDDWPAPPNSPIDFGGQVPLIKRSLPSTIASAWQRVDEDAFLARALTSWHQGRLLATQFPSYALIAYCAAIETLARTTSLGPKVSDVLAKNAIPGKGPSDRSTFWATISLVRSPEVVTSIRSRFDPYGARSSTAHGSKTHGIEDSYGYEHMMKYTAPRDGAPGGIFPDTNDPTQGFMWQTLPEIELAARELLLKILF